MATTLKESGFVVTVDNVDCGESADFHPKVLVPRGEPRVFRCQADADKAITRSANVCKLVSGSLVDELPAVKELKGLIPKYRVTSRRERSKNRP